MGLTRESEDREWGSLGDSRAPRDTQGRQEWEEAKDSPLEPPQGAGPGRLGFGLLGPRAVRGPMSAARPPSLWSLSPEPRTPHVAPPARVRSPVLSALMKLIIVFLTGCAHLRQTHGHLRGDTASWQSSCPPFTGWGARDVTHCAGHSVLPTDGLQFPGTAGPDFGKDKGCGPPPLWTPALQTQAPSPGHLSASCARGVFVTS